MMHHILHDRLQGEDFSNLNLPEGRLLSTPWNLNPKENLWDEIREKIFKDYALKSIDAMRAKLKDAIIYTERNPQTVKSIIPLYPQVTLMWTWYHFSKDAPSLHGPGDADVAREVVGRDALRQAPRTGRPP